MIRSFWCHRATRIAAKTAFSFFVVTLALICFSDQAFSFIFENPYGEDREQIYKILFLAAVAALVAFFISRREILKLHQVQLSLTAKELYLASVVRAAPIGIGVVKDDVLIEVNDRLCSLTGYDREQLIGRGMRIFYPEDDKHDRVEPSRYDQLNQGGTGSVETRWQSKDGRLIEILLSFTPINGDDPQAGVTFTALDISEAKTIERNLLDREAHLHSIIDLAVDGILIGNYEGVIIEANHHICVMFGIKREALIGKHIDELAFTRESLAAAPFRFDLLQRGETVISEQSFVRPDGSTIFVETRSKMMPDGTYQSFYRDITTRRHTEQALRESEEKFALAFDASPDAVNINRLEDGMYIDINQGFTELTGYTWEDVRGKTFLDLKIWHDLADRQRLIEALQTHGSCTNLEALFRKKDGSLGIGLMSARTIQLGNATHILSITRDITERKQAAADLERLRVAIEQAGEVVVIADTAGNIQYANPAFERTTGYALEEVYQRNPRILKSGQHDSTFYRALWATITSGQTWSGRMINRKKDGSLYTEEATISPVLNPQGKVVNYVAIKRDITAQLKLEAQCQQAQKMESIGRLTGGVAHDFNNMLAVIIGYAEMAMIKIATEHRAYPDIEKILEAAHRSADIVQQLLAFARKQAIAPKVIDLNNLVRGMLKMLRRLIGEEIELIWSPETNLPPLLMDPVQVDQILVNLCINARDAIDGTGTIALQTRPTTLDANFCRQHPGTQEGDYVALTVADNGCGMEPKILDKIFDPFFTTKGLHGTGLGLATVYGIVSQNRGIITVNSQPGQGTTFTIYLPAHHAQPVSSPLIREQKQPLPGRGETILLVEDDPGILKLGRTMLGALGYNVFTDLSPTQALKRVRQYEGDIDLLITDVIMPEMNGIQLAQELLESRPRMRVLYMSGYTADIIAKHGTLHNKANFLQKPFDLKTLSIKIKEVLALTNPELIA
ncbi:PAS domain S-box protein [Desulfobulbus propionicus]